MNKYLKITYKNDTEECLAKYDEEMGEYITEGIMYQFDANIGEGGHVVAEDGYFDLTFEEMNNDPEMIVTVLSEEDYNRQIKMLLFKLYDEEVADLEKKLRQKIKERNSILL